MPFVRGTSLVYHCHIVGGTLGLYVSLDYLLMDDYPYVWTLEHHLAYLGHLFMRLTTL